MNRDFHKRFPEPASGGPARWYDRWENALFADNPRLRDFARQCATTVEIMSLAVKGHRIVAAVRHRSQRRITVTAGLTRYPAADWYRSLSGEADRILEASRRGGKRLSTDVLSLLADAGQGLWPAGLQEIQLNVAPHSEQTPCPWCMAVLVESGWLMEQDPLLLFQLRGLQKDDVAGLATYLEQVRSGRRLAGESVEPAVRGANFHDRFWGDLRAIRSLHRHVEDRQNPGAPAYRLGSPSAGNGAGNDDLSLLVEAIYARARQSG